MKIDILRRELSKRQENGESYETIARGFGVNKGLIYKIVKKGHEPTKRHVREKLGLDLYGRAPVCKSCGQIHVSGRCPHKPKTYRDLWSMPAAKLREALLNRKDI